MSPDALLRKAHDSLRLARSILAIREEKAARREAYFAAFSAARAYLFAAGKTPKTHSGVRTLFGLIATERGLDPEHGRFLARGSRYKTIADYEVGDFIYPEGAEDTIARAERFIAAVEAALKGD